MSARAIRKLREDREAALAAAAAAEEDEDDESESEEHDQDQQKNVASRTFALMNDDSSSSSDNDDDDDDDDTSINKEHEKVHGNDGSEKQAQRAVSQQVDKNQEQEEENLDALLEQFKEQDNKIKALGGASTEDNHDAASKFSEELSCFRELLAKLDIKDLDVDHVVRTSLLSAEPSADNDEGDGSNNNTKGKRRNRQTFLFGNPRDLNVNVKPPHYVGGGIGMTTYDRESEIGIPWPYSGRNDNRHENNDDDNNNNDTMTICQDRKRWFTFIYSDSYPFDDFQRIQESGDLNALVLFVAHHPFVVEALVNLGIMLYHANQAQEGLTFLRRSLWVYESSTLSSFSGRVFDGQPFFMDFDRRENRTYFDALFKLARVNNMSGMARSSFAIGRYLLSLDPLRDPTGILLALDHFALASNSDKNDRWLVDLVENKNVRVYYCDETTGIEYHCELSDLPNWAYSYALSLFRLNNSRPDEMSNKALQSAISRFPSIVDLLLNENNIDINSRSCRLDWQAVMDYTGSRANAIHGCSAVDEMDPLLRMATERAYDLTSRVFAKLNHNLWASDGVMLWLHSSLEELKKGDSPDEPTPLSPALMRYSRIDPGDFETKFQLLPAEANPLDPGLVNHALVIDPNRRRFWRAQRGGQRGDGFDDDLLLFGQAGNAVRPTLFGPPSNIIDLDWPMLEIFWRSLLPWNRIEEIPRPRP